jgi:hypothetical protein
MASMTISCPCCDAPVPYSREALDRREDLACGACGQATALDGERFQAATRQHLKRTFSSTGPFPLQHRRFRVAMEELVPGAPAPKVAYFPALGRRPFAIGDSEAQALESLRMATKIWQRGGHVSGELPASDANADDPWLAVEA